ncbi:MAG TPA: hypothetical protein VL527_10030 [Dongiaceae bacterium]|jgi:hypothetical protein|nr:hypothetical protein [Dongiaceae bacterium]
MKRLLALLVVSSFCSFNLSAQGLDAAVQAKLDAKIKALQGWAADPAIVDAVKAHNASPAPEAAGMTQEKWKSASVLDPVVRSFSKNAAANFLKSKKTEDVSEAFLSGADGTKVAFLSKPSNWSHQGKAKHDNPMAGKTWQGAVEVDESSGQQQIQLAVPVLDGTKPIGSLVVGFNISKLTAE